MLLVDMMEWNAQDALQWLEDRDVSLVTLACQIEG